MVEACALVAVAALTVLAVAIGALGVALWFRERSEARRLLERNRAAWDDEIERRR